MKCPVDHEKYYSSADAERALRRLIVQAKQTGLGGKSYKRLNVFRCGNHFHVGRSNTRQSNHHKPAPKLPSFGELRRKLERMARQWERHDDYQRRQRAEAIGKLIAAEQQVVAAENELRELQHQTLRLFFPEMR